MSTKNVNTSASTFDPTSMATYSGFQPQVSNNLSQFANDPMKSSFFNTMLQMSQQQNQASFGARNNAFMQNLQTGGNVGNLPAFAQDQLNRNMRGLSADNSNSFNNLLLGTNQLRFGATSQMAGYRPLQTGQTQTQQQIGLGSWLPQVLGAGMGIAGAAIGGPTGSALGSSFFAGANKGPTNPFGAIPQDVNGPQFGNPGFISSMPSTAPGTWN